MCGVHVRGAGVPGRVRGDACAAARDVRGDASECNRSELNERPILGHSENVQILTTLTGLMWMNIFSDHKKKIDCPNIAPDCF